MVQSSVRVGEVVGRRVLVSRGHGPHFLRGLVRLQNALFLFLATGNRTYRSLFLGVVVSMAYVRAVLQPGSSRCLYRFFQVVRYLVFVIGGVSYRCRRVQVLLVSLLYRLLRLLTSGVVSRVGVYSRGRVWFLRVSYLFVGEGVMLHYVCVSNARRSMGASY